MATVSNASDAPLTDVSRILAASPSLTESDRSWLHHLIADWSVIADLGYADLELIVPAAGGGFVYAAQCRPSTGVSTRPEDLAGSRVDSAVEPFVKTALRSTDVLRVDSARRFEGAAVCDAFVSVCHEGRAIAVVVRETNLATRTRAGHYEEMGIRRASELFAMIAHGRFPYSAPVNGQRHNAHVPDGFLVLDAVGCVLGASPNAVSCFRRLGYEGRLTGENLLAIGVGLAADAGRSLPKDVRVVLGGQDPVDAIFTVNDVSATIRSLPLSDDGDYAGAVILCREITELRRRDQELKMKDDTIAEIHHRVKNNLQSVSALLRLQARRASSQEVKDALAEAQQRVQTIAILHEGLSQSADEVLDFDAVLANLLHMSVDVASVGNQKIDVSYIGKFGRMTAQEATPLSLILSELVTNSVEHGFEGRDSGAIVVSVERSGDNVIVSVEDNGNGIPAARSGDGPDSGLGTQLVCTFVKSNFNGDVKWEPRSGGGTRVAMNLQLRDSQGW